MASESASVSPTATAGAAEPGRSAGGAAALDLLRLTKPRITGYVVITAAAGFLAASGGVPDPALLLHTLVGTALLASGTNGLNQVLERRADARMRRTRHRPLPAGRLRVRDAAAFTLLLVGAGTVYLLLTVNLLTAALGFATAALYALAYTPLKRVSPLATLVGAVPGALPVLGGWTAARGELAAGGWALFGILFLWQLPHVLALGWLHREDYRRAGFRVLAAADSSGWKTRARSVTFALVLVPVSLLPAVLGVAGPGYFAAAGGLGALYLGSAVRFAWRGGRREARGMFHTSLLYLPLLLGALVLDGAWTGGLLSRAVGWVGGTVAGAPAQASLNAALNGTAAAALAAGWHFVRRGRLRAHRFSMLSAAGASAAFLLSYVIYHLRAGSVEYGGAGWDALVYYGILISHAVLAAAVVPLVAVTLWRAFRGRRRSHRRIARWTLPIWGYVSVTGLVVYLMLYGA